MKTTDLMRQRIREFSQELQEEFGPLAVAEHGCLLEAAEEWGVQLGNELARAATDLALPATTDPSEEAACPQCRRPAHCKRLRKRRIETRSGAIHLSEPEHYCHPCRRSFFPLTRALGMGPDETLCPALLKKVVHVASCSASFGQAEEDLRVLAEVKVSANRIHRVAQRVGSERVADGQAAVTAYELLPLPSRQQSPGPAPPDIACIQADGGRIQIRPRDREPNAADSWWRETKVGCLLAMTSERQAQDPAPQILETLVDHSAMAKIPPEIKGVSAGEAATEAARTESRQPPREAPQVVAQPVVATTKNVAVFGDLLVAQTRALGFAAAERKAFVADGSETNWGLWRRHFSRCTPILDWVQAVCYVYAAAMAGVRAAEGWATYRQWAQWLWSGEVGLILEQLRERLRRIGLPAEGDPETSFENRVSDALRYLANQCSRMNYPEYRRLGLPITSSHVESTIKRINRRMQGTEKFLETGAEPLIQLVADHLGPVEQRARYWSDRPQRLSSQRCYHQAA